MKKIFIKAVLAVILVSAFSSAAAQQVNTLYFIDNAPVRQNINPAFSPLSNFYLSLPVVGSTSFWIGNEGSKSLSASDLIFNNAAGQTITFLHPEADREKFLDGLNKTTLFNMDFDVNLLSFGFRFKEKNYLHLTVKERIDAGVGLPKDMFTFLLGGGMQDLDGGDNYLDLTSLGFKAQAYTEIGLGYSRQLNDKWSFGLKLKYLAGNFYTEMSNSNLYLNATADRWEVSGKGSLYMSAPVVTFPQTMPTMEQLSDPMTLLGLNDISVNGFSDVLPYLKPAGNGFAFDLGFAYQPIKYMSITASLTDVGFISWKGAKYNYNMDGSFEGAGELVYSEFVDENGSFNTQALQDTVLGKLQNLYNGITGDYASNHYVRALSAKLNVGVDFKFWDNRIGLGLYSRTRFVSNQVYEELTIGASFKPIHVLNIAASYSLINGKQHTIGAAVGLVTWEGIGVYVAADYTPLYYAKANIGGTDRYVIPYYNNGFNLALGLNVVIGHNYKKIKAQRQAQKDEEAAQKAAKAAQTSQK